MISTSLGDVATIVQGRLHNADPNTRVTGKVEFDSRNVGPGDVFLAIAGEHADGHDFAGRAVENGAVGVLAQHELDLPCVLITDPMLAITQLASTMASRLSAIRIGITGSSGKTSTKDLLAQVLAAAGPTVAPPGSFNNELGFPYTVLMADADTSFLVLEASARGIGHIRALSAIAQPRIGIVLNVGRAHLGEFGSVAAIAQAKGELVEALPAATEGGVAVLNADDPRVIAMASRTTAAIRTFGVGESLAGSPLDVAARDVALDAMGRASFRLQARGEHHPVQLRLHGLHHVSNALAAAAAAVECGLPVAEVARSLSEATAQSHWRMEVVETTDDITIVNDAYNANPESMQAAIRATVQLAHGRRTVAVLAHMAELGPASDAAHEALGKLAMDAGISRLLVVGEHARPILLGAAGGPGQSDQSEWVPDVTAAIDRLSDILEPGDVVLIKGSRAAGMERVAHALITRRGARP